MPANSTAEIVAILRETLAETPELSAVFLFGSAARGTLRPASDVDIALRWRKGSAPATGRGKMLDWMGRLGVALGRDAHLVDLDTAPPELRRRIYHEGIVIADDEPERTRADHLQSVSQVVDWEIARRIRDEVQDRQLRAHLRSTKRGE